MNLDDYKIVYCQAVDHDAGRARGLVYSAGPYMDQVYMVKRLEAERCLADTEPLAASYPLLAEGGTPDAAELTTRADAVLTAASACDQRVGAIEGIRFAAKAAIMAASDIAAVDAVIETLVWPD